MTRLEENSLINNNNNICSDLSRKHFLYKILNPRSICVFGANNNLISTMGSMQLRNIVAGGGFGDKIYPIHPRLDTVQGFKAYQSVLDLPETPDLAFLILPTKVVPQVMEECGQKGIKNLLITSGGFREIGSNGVELSQQIDEIAKKYNMRFIGPNCLGIYNGWYGYPEKKDAYFNTLWIYTPHIRGNISIASQSGTIAAQTSWYTNSMGVKVGKAMSVGNEKNIDLVDFLEYFKLDPQTEVIGLYIEEIKRGKEFIKLAKEITPKKPIVAIYAGGTKAAQRSIMSHTGSIGGNNKIYDAVFKETGIISTDSIMDFLYYLRTLSHAQTYGTFPKTRNVGIITDSGGAGSMMTKTAELYGLNIPQFSKELSSKIKTMIPSTASALNPIDLTFDVNRYNMFLKFPRLLIKSGEVDSIIVFGVFDLNEILEVVEKSGFTIDQELKNSVESLTSAFFKPILRLMTNKKVPIYFVGPQPYKYSTYQEYIANDIPIFSMWDHPTKCLKILCEYSEYRKKFENP